MEKMIVSSFYNNLIDKEEAIPTSIMLELERLRAKNIIFVVGTNRSYQEVLDYNKDFPFLDYIIAFNGCYLYDVSKEKCLYKKKLSSSIIKKISTIFKEYPITYYSETSQYHKEEETEKEKIYKMEIEISNRKEWEKIKNIKINSSIFLKDEKLFLEVTSNSSNMFSGVDQISIRNNIKLEDIIAICSNESDSSIIKGLPKSYIIENSYDLIKNVSLYNRNPKRTKRLIDILKRI